MFERFYPDVAQIYPDVPEKLQFNETLKRVLNRYVDDLITNTRARIDQARIQTVEEVRHHTERLAAFSPRSKPSANKAKNFSTIISTTALPWPEKKTMPSA